MKNFLILLTAVLLLNFTGCSTYKEYKSLPDDQKAAYLRDQARSWLKDNKETVKSGLVIAGLEIMNRAVSDDERKEISNQMWAASVAFNSLATGKKVEAAQVSLILRQFSSGTSSQNYVKYIAQASQVWSVIYGKLNLSEDPKLVIEYLMVLSEASQKVAEAYQ